MTHAAIYFRVGDEAERGNKSKAMGREDQIGINSSMSINGRFRELLVNRTDVWFVGLTLSVITFENRGRWFKWA